MADIEGLPDPYEGERLDRDARLSSRAYRDGFAAGRAAATPDVSHAVCSRTYVPADRAGEALLRIRKLVKDANGWPTCADPPAAATPDPPQLLTFCIVPDCGLRAARTLSGADGVRRPYCDECAPAAASPDERLREALELIRAHARLDLTERGIAEAERYAAIADDALTARDQETER